MANIGFLPPQAIDIEKAVLGALMLQKDVFYKISSFIRSETFYVEAHQRIYNAIRSLSDANKPVDLLTVTNSLRQDGTLEIIGGAYYLTELTDGVVGTTSIEEYSLILNQKYLERELIVLCQEYAKSVYEGASDVFDLYDNLSSDIFNKVSVNAGKQASRIDDIIRERIKLYEKPVENGLTGITSGFKEVDQLTNGWQDSDLIIIAARPGMGKTAFVLNLARNAAIDGQKAGAIFSLEMSKEQLVDRMVSAETEIYLEKFKKRNLSDHEWQMLHSRINSLMKSNIYIDDTPALPIQMLRSKAIRLKHKYGIGWLVVDYLQLMRGDREGKSGNREQEISSISRGLKAIAKELDIPVIALSQLSRAVESRPGSMKRPMLSDLRESGAIEQDADMVMFLFRPEYYGIEEDEEGRPTLGICESIIAKNRHGSLDTAVLKFNGAMMKFADLEASNDSFSEGFSSSALQPNSNFGDEPF
ncbi:replicative DNA helicase [Sphingobacterium sp. LRF_L2]|uniref:replicative DNA helicase n=1 Tax=Sphingobacterium sp. LRF_L2 TaxID=3369421 RepID=UPI003F6454BC